MSEQQKNGTSQNEAADAAKLDDKALDDVQGGLLGPGSCYGDEDYIKINKKGPGKIPADYGRSFKPEDSEPIEKLIKDK